MLRSGLLTKRTIVRPAGSPATPAEAAATSRRSRGAAHGTAVALAAVLVLDAACGGAAEPAPPPADAGASAGGEAPPKPPTKLHIGVPRPLQALVQPLRIASRLGVLDRVRVVASAPAGAADSAPTYALVSDDAESASMVAGALSITAFEQPVPTGAARRPTVRRLKARATLRPAAEAGAAAAPDADGLPTGTLVLALLDEGDAAAGPVEVIAAGARTGWLDGALLEPSSACVPDTASIAAAGAKADGRGPVKLKREPDAFEVWVEAGPHRLQLSAVPELDFVTLARVVMADEGCVATPDGAGFYLEGTLHDLRFDGEALVVEYRDGESTAVAEQRWVPEPGKTGERIRPEAGDKTKLLAALARSSAPLTDDLLLCAPDEPTAASPKTLGKFIAAQRKRSRATRVVCVPASDDGSRRCTAELGALEGDADGDDVEVEFSVTGADVRPTSCLRL